MSLQIDDPELEARILAIGDSQTLPCPSKTLVAREILRAAVVAYETGDLSRMLRLLQLAQPIPPIVRVERRPNPQAWQPELERKTDEGL